MREIKFRAWHKGVKEMLFGTNENTFRWQAEGQPIELMQFTGLKDKNWKEIYEGDIIGRHGMDNTFVEYYNGRWVLRNDTKNVEWRQDLHTKISQHLEVIGNIYEHEYFLNENKISK